MAAFISAEFPTITPPVKQDVPLLTGNSSTFEKVTVPSGDLYDTRRWGSCAAGGMGALRSN